MLFHVLYFQLRKDAKRSAISFSIDISSLVIQIGAMGMRVDVLRMSTGTNVPPFLFTHVTQRSLTTKFIVHY